MPDERHTNKGRTSGPLLPIRYIFLTSARVTSKSSAFVHASRKKSLSCSIISSLTARRTFGYFVQDYVVSSIFFIFELKCLLFGLFNRLFNHIYSRWHHFKFCVDCLADNICPLSILAFRLEFILHHYHLLLHLFQISFSLLCTTPHFSNWHLENIKNCKKIHGIYAFSLEGPDLHWKFLASHWNLN